MTISRLCILLAVLSSGLGSIYCVPRDNRMRDSRISMDLPDTFQDWDGQPAVVTQAERSILAADTQFSRKVYSDPFDDHVFVSIVMSGQDLDASIHRPERCLAAQGWRRLDSHIVNVPVPSAEGGVLPVMRLHNVRQAKTADGRVFEVYNLDYYWFVGNQTVTASHWTREFVDMKDRLLYGYNQHWAYITVSSTITEGLQPLGKSEAETDRMLQRLIQDLYPILVKDAPVPATAG